MTQRIEQPLSTPEVSDGDYQKPLSRAITACYAASLTGLSHSLAKITFNELREARLRLKANDIDGCWSILANTIAQVNTALELDNSELEKEAEPEMLN
ncbi:hypothetical protein ACFL2V_13365 [Pseudomonadota bacterium]